MDSPILFNGLSDLAGKDQVFLSQYGRGSTIKAPHATVHGAFEGIVDSHPHQIAATFQHERITYRELDVAANQLANYLIASRLRPQQRVCLVAQRSIELLIGIFAVLKAGGQYVPIDGGVSSEVAMGHIFQDTGAQFILCLPHLEEKVRRNASRTTLVILLGKKSEALCSQQRPDISVSPEDGAYAIYTSGTTGKPKGVDVSHGNVTNALLLEPANLGITLGSKVAQVLNIAFDMGAWEILACLMNGGTLRLRGSDWVETLKKIDTLISTPSILSKFRRDDYHNIKTIVTGGEPCPQTLADEWAQSSIFYNICGPTEITILNTAHRHIPGQPLSIGRPLPNTTLYVLDEDEKPVPVGSKGTMWVGGAGVSRGYINLPELTAKRYKFDKFLNDGSVMFNTGDIVQWGEDGSVKTFGRADDQVKIKGFRVELDGVTAVLEKYPGITRACATVVEGVLFGFYAASTFIGEDDLKAFVQQHLPYYSVPGQWIFIADIPLTSNGKVDKKQLAALALRANNNITELFYTASSGASSTTDTEKNGGSIANLSTNSSDDSSTTAIEKPELLPAKNGFYGQRWLRHRAFILYRKFFSVVVMANVAAAVAVLYLEVHKGRRMLADLATATATNLCMAVLMRSEPVINLLFTVFCSVPLCFPLSIRRHCARIFHIGGIHSGCALSATMWFGIFAIVATLDYAKGTGHRSVRLASIVITYLILLLLIAMASLSYPAFRAKHHDTWEMVHRFGGWMALVLLWIQVYFTTKDLNPGRALSQTYPSSPPVWLLTVATMAIIFPWLHLRKVPVRSEVLSSHAIRLHFDYTNPVVGTAVRLAERPLVDWHGFATITNANGKGFSLIVSNAGNFTKRTIERAPSCIWVRGIPTCGVLRICTAFKSVVLVATGSGIGPCLAVILAKKTPARILWTAPNPEQIFGKSIINAVFEKDPKAIIHNTRTMGKPDMNLMAYQLWKESGAEAVCVISNKTFTTRIVYAMESRGIPAYGAIFDS